MGADPPPRVGSAGAAEAGSAARILVSSCLLGCRVRYDGGHQKLDDWQLSRWVAAGRVVACCPEVLGGLPVPRPPAEIAGGDGADVLAGRARVTTADGEDVTAAFRTGAEAALGLARTHDIRVALLCQRSPSCGSRQIYDGRFQGLLIPGKGVTTALLAAAGIAVFGPEAVAQAAAHLAGT